MENLLVIVFICIFLFFVLREVFCWYWKINKHLALMDEKNEILDSIRVHLSQVVDSLNRN